MSANKNSKLKNFFRHQFNQRYADLILISLILISVFIILGEAAQIFSPHILGHLDQINHYITIIFIIELSIRFWIAKNRNHFLLEYLTDIISVIPIFRAFRILRVLRLIRIFRMGILLSRRITFLSSILQSGIHEHFLLLLLITIVVLTGAIGISHAEAKANPELANFYQALWWSILSLVAGEPIGMTPVTTLGKILTLLVMFGGMSVFAIFTGIISAFMVQRLRHSTEVSEMNLELLEHHIIICGWNRAGRIIIEEFQTDPRYRKREILILAELEHESKLLLNFGAINREKIYFLSADYTNVNYLKKAGVENADIAILLADKSLPRSDQDRDARTILAALTIEKLNPRIYTCVELLNRDNDSHIKMIGVEEIVVGDEYSGNIIAASARNLGIIPILDELLTSKYGNQFYKVPVPAPWLGKNVGEVTNLLKTQYGAILIALARSQLKKNLVNPPAEMQLEPEDQLVLIAQVFPKFTPVSGN